MKVQDFAYQVALKTIELLEETQHYKIPEKIRQEITDKLLEGLDGMIQSPSK
jgi:hypothetical protein